MAKSRIEYLNEEKREHNLRPNKFWKVDIFKPIEENLKETDKGVNPSALMEESEKTEEADDL